ncbi:hypothetical protein G8S49_06395 [Clostridium botulinum C]|uniref:Uncharacterized protein n=3 Tax=Clostridium botulinum TaxID=1491 RepID=A0A9Q4TIF8_CLOBO|nr:hypothetical protein [Clostridium botulinum]YP_398433.1 hypothetical protein CST003 [Clostridium phage c-st]MCD3196074.1 hypothetical protein [Clostridium botulinum C]MCD3200322.1 hypothetical protein [Clostridium botulinum C]MCD3206930.1 hypothetical protein [Clostridium botulinum C]MCD3207554.1 hypothetical protein [Clostridium botulinum C]MCD3217356.1 hypothetical protein [Clostridium botulinum C]
MNNYKINKNHEIIINSEFNLGEIKEITNDNVVPITVSVKYGSKIMKKSLIRHIRNDDLDEIDNILEEYFQYRLLEQLGVMQYPLVERNGKIEGFEED